MIDCSDNQLQQVDVLIIRRGGFLKYPLIPIVDKMIELCTDLTIVFLDDGETLDPVYRRSADTYVITLGETFDWGRALIAFPGYGQARQARSFRQPWSAVARAIAIITKEIVLLKEASDKNPM